MQIQYWFGAGGWLALAAFAAWADRRRTRREDLDRVGWVPWPLVLIVAIVATALCVAVAIRS